MKLLIDVNVKGIARWLRFLGIDTIIADEHAPDSAIRTQAFVQDRILITKDHELANSMPSSSVILLNTNQTKSQISEVLNRITPPEASQWFTRCTQCNTSLTGLEDEKINQDIRIPAFIKMSQDPDQHRAWMCESCDRVYWKGSHYNQTKEVLKKL